MKPPLPPSHFPGSHYSRLHLRFGWWSLLVFAFLGLVLETLHGFKVALYLDLANDTRRLMWTLAHAHGIGLALVHLLFALQLQLQVQAQVLPAEGASRHALVSKLLIASSILLPGGFFAGGAVYYGGDPGLGILLVPVGAALLLIAVFLLAKS